MADEFVVKGLDKLNEFLQQLPVKIEKNVLRGSLRAGMRVVLPAAAAKIHNVSGELAKGLRIRTRAKGGTVTAVVKATGPHASIAHLVEFGTSAHRINAKSGGWLSLGGLFAKSVEHPGAEPHPFMRPALDQEARNAVVASAEYMKQRLATKEGLDTADIVIDGDSA